MLILGTSLTVTTTCRKADDTACGTVDADAEPGGVAIVNLQYDYEWVSFIPSAIGLGTTGFAHQDHRDEDRVKAIRFGRAGVTGGRDERGATIVIVATVTVLLLTFVAVAVDISMLVNDEQELHDTLDTAAHAGAFKLPDDPAGARADALAFVAKNFPSAPAPVVDTWCIVGAALVRPSTRPPSPPHATRGPRPTPSAPTRV